MKTQNLKPLHRRICEEWIHDYNATRVARECGTKLSVVNEVVESAEGAEYIAWLENNRSARTAISADRVLRELAAIAFLDPRRLMRQDQEGNVRLAPLDEISDEDAAAIASVQKGKGGCVQIKTCDKLNALEKIGKHLGMFREQVDQRMLINAMPDIVVGGEGVSFNIGADPESVPAKKE